VLAGSIQRGFAKGLSTAGMGVDSGDQAGEGVGDDDEVRITNKNLRATIRKSKEVLAMHRNLLEQVWSPCSVSGIQCLFLWFVLFGF
jgi:starch synthase